MENALVIIAAVILGGFAITNVVLKGMSDFRKISRIVTNVFKCLQTEHWSQYQSEEELLVYTGIIAMSIRAGPDSADAENIAVKAVHSSKTLIEPTEALPRIRGYRESDREKSRLLLNFIVSVELMVYMIERPDIDEQSMHRILSKRIYEIEYTMVQTLRRTSIPGRISAAVAQQLAGIDKGRIRRALSMTGNA